MYPIDLQTILQILNSQSGELRTKVRQVTDIRGECQASVILAEGKVVSCEIIYRGTPVLVGERAFHTLISKGTLEWEYIPASSSQPDNSSVQSQAARAKELYARQESGEYIVLTAYPVQLTRRARDELAHWPRLHRFVYQLSTGDKTVEEVARLLSLSPERMQAILQDLIRDGNIYLRSASKNPGI